MCISATGEEIYEWIYTDELFMILPINIILYIGLCIEVLVIFTIHYAIPIASFNISERSIF